MPSAHGTTTTARLKIVIRRLPPGLSQEEFEASLGDDWKAGKGRVDWAAYKPGKVSKDLSKPSRPSRAYLNLTKQDYVGLLSDTIHNTKFNDAKASSKDPILLGLPTVEYAPYTKIPHTTSRKDNRQGTIDQDPEFIQFLESLTNPVPKTTTVDQRDGKNKEKVTTTPLIQYLKDKKANKAKEAASNSKAAKHARQPSKDTQSTTSSSSDKKSPAKTTPSTAQSSDKRSAQAIMVEKAARDAARVLNKQAAIPSKSQAPVAAAATPATLPTTPVNSPLAEKKRERGSASAAASILRRDLGLVTTPGSRGGRRGPSVGQAKPSSNSSPQPTSTTSVRGGDSKPSESLTATSLVDIPDTGKTTVAPTAPRNPTQASSTPKPPTGPAASRGSSRTNAAPSVTPNANPPSAPLKPNPVSPTATQAFLKHANPSQGITEALLEEAFGAFGTVTRVEIDKKKGSAYVDFEEPEGLQKAIKASPIKVAQGQVVVLERRLGPNVQPRNVRGGTAMNNRGAPDARGGMLNHRGRGGMINNRGGGIPMGPMGGRGGSVRGRGGFPRGGAVVHNNRPATTTTPQPHQGTDAATNSTSTPEAKPAASMAASSSEAVAPQAAPPIEDTAAAVTNTQDSK
ncbi:MAG: hypothetical protein Q9224_003724 [Gallowayella concinna]